MPYPAVQLTIPQPCAESWAQMTPATTGRHCASCEKVVIDFTRMTDGELAAWFGTRRGQPTCGRLRADQVGRVLLPTARPAPGWWRWAVATLAVLGWQELSADATLAQAPKHATSSHVVGGSRKVTAALAPQLRLVPGWQSRLALNDSFSVRRLPPGSVAEEQQFLLGDVEDSAPPKPRAPAKQEKQ